MRIYKTFSLSSVIRSHCVNFLHLIKLLFYHANFLKSSSESLHDCLNDLMKRIIYLNYYWYNQIKLHCTSTLKVHLLSKLGKGCCSIHNHHIHVPELLNWTTPVSTALQVTMNTWKTNVSY